MFSGVVANGNLQSHGSHSHGMERRYHCFSFIFGFYLLHEFVKGYVSVSRFRFFFSHVFIIMAFGVPYDLYEPTVY
jgi:hypothetical protein